MLPVISIMRVDQQGSHLCFGFLPCWAICDCWDHRGETCSRVGVQLQSQPCQAQLLLLCFICDIMSQSNRVLEKAYPFHEVILLRVELLACQMVRWPRFTHVCSSSASAAVEVTSASISPRGQKLIKIPPALFSRVHEHRLLNTKWRQEMTTIVVD